MIVVTPYGWPCKFEDCPPGLFVCMEGKKTDVYLKTEYGNDEGYCPSGERYHGKGMVQPIIIEEMEE